MVDVVADRAREPLRLWADSLGGFVATKRGFAAALHSGDPAYAPLPTQFLGVLAPKVQAILDAGAAAGTMGSDIRAEDLIRALSHLADSQHGGTDEGARQMTEVLLDGLRPHG